MRTQSDGETLKVLGLDRLSGTNSNHFKELVKARLTEQHRVVEVDFAGVKFVDSEGLGALVSANKAVAPRQGVVRIIHPQEMVRKLLEAVSFHKLLEIVP